MSWGAVDRTRAERIPAEECLRLLRGAQVGRLAYVGDGGPVVAHVAYRVVDGALIVRSGASPIIAAARARQRVAFEVDDDVASRGGTWTVLVRGELSEVESHRELELLQGLWFQPSGDEDGRHLRLVPESVTGERRRLEPALASLVVDEPDHQRPLRSRISPD